MSETPSRRQIVFNWIMGEDLADSDGYWAGSDGLAAVDELLAALDVDTEAQLRTANETLERLTAENSKLLMFSDNEKPYLLRVFNEVKKALESARADVEQLTATVAQQAEEIAELKEELDLKTLAASGQRESTDRFIAQQAATISTVTEFLKAIVIAFKEPDGGPCFKLRAFAESKGIYADDLGRDRVMLRIAQAALDCIPREDKP